MTERCIYFIKPVGMKGPVKIGISARSAARLFELLEWSPFDLELAHSMPGTYKLERQIQEALADDHLRREWFKPSARVVQLLRDLQSGVPIERAIDLTRKEGEIRRPSKPSNSPPRRKRIVGRSGLTQGQLECLKFIKQFIADRVRPPTYQEICDGMDLHSKSGVHRYITALVERGYLEKTEGRQGSLVVIDEEPMARAA